MFDCDDYLSSGSDESLPLNAIYDRYQSGNGYHAVPPPTQDHLCHPNLICTYHRRWVSDFEDESKTKPPQNAPSFVQSTKQVKSPRPSVQHVETSILAATLKPASPKLTSNGKSKNRKECFVCKSLDHLIKDYDYHDKKMAQPTARIHAHRGNHKYYAYITLITPQRHVVPAAVVTQSKPVSITAARPVGTAVPKIMVTRPRHAKPIVTKTNSPTRRYINRSPSSKSSNSPPRVTTLKAPVINAAKGNMSHLSNFEELNGGYVAFGGNPKGDHLGKFDGKADKGFFIGYFLNNKAFRVFNSRTRIMKENLHIRFSESTPNVVGSGPDWLFDIDALTRTINHEPIVAGTQSNGFADLSKESRCNDQEKEDNVSSTNNVNTISSTVNVAGTNKVNVVGGIISSELLFDLNMPALEDVGIFDFSRDDDVVTNMNNLDTTIQVSPTPTIRIHKDHPLDQVIGDLHSATQTRKMSKNLEEHRKNPKRLFLAYASFKDLVVYQMDVKIAFLYGKIEKEVYVCQPPGFEDPDFPDRVYKVKKALYGLHQAPRAWFTEVKTISTLMETQKPLLKDKDGEEMDVHMYR
nr:putative ribonuclease H-like domain-containing protein [Tanacetum cinerariifolium]